MFGSIYKLMVFAPPIQSAEQAAEAKLKGN